MFVDTSLISASNLNDKDKHCQSKGNGEDAIKDELKLINISILIWYKKNNEESEDNKY